MEFNFKSYDNSRQSISYCEVDKCKKVVELREQLKAKEQRIVELNKTIQAKEQECEELKRIRDGNFLHALEEQKRADKYFKTLTEIKEIAEAHKKDESVWNPYRQLDKILQKISECEGNDE